MVAVTLEIKKLALKKG